MLLRICYKITQPIKCSSVYTVDRSFFLLVEGSVSWAKCRCVFSLEKVCKNAITNGGGGGEGVEFSIERVQ